MEIKSFMLSDQEVANAVEMFVMETKSKYGYIMENVTDLSKAELSCKINTIDIMIPCDFVNRLVDFKESFDKNWDVYLMYGDREVCGLIAFTDWCG